MPPVGEITENTEEDSRSNSRPIELIEPRVGTGAIGIEDPVSGGGVPLRQVLFRQSFRHRAGRSAGSRLPQLPADGASDPQQQAGGEIRRRAEHLQAAPPPAPRGSRDTAQRLAGRLKGGGRIEPGPALYLGESRLQLQEKLEVRLEL